MDLKHFTKTSEAKDHTVLSHPDGHEIKVLHAKLDKGELKKLKALPMAMADGGDTDEASEQDAEPTAPPVPQAAPQQAQVPPGVDYSQELQKDINMQRQGMQGQAQAAGNLGAAQAQHEQETLNDAVKQQQTFDQTVNGINSERAAAIEDYKKGHINPEDFYDNPEHGHSRVMTGIGLILGGLGGGLTHQGNPALNFLNQQIDRNIAAQTADMNKKQNVMTALTQQLGNVKDAASMHGVMQRDILSHQLNEQAQKAISPQAKAQAQQAIGALQAQNAPVLAQLAYRQSVIKGMQAGQLPPEAGVQALVEPTQQAKVYEALGKVRSLNSMQQDMQQNADKLNQKLLHGALSPNDTEAMVMQYAGPLQHVAEGRYNKEGAEQQIRNLMPNKTDSPSTAQHKDVLRAQFFNTLKANHAPVLVGNHIPVPQPRAHATQRSYRAGSNQ